jgi:hypothetical protein
VTADNRARARDLLNARLAPARGVSFPQLEVAIAKALDEAETRGVQRAVIAQNAAAIDVVIAPDSTFVGIEVGDRAVEIGERIARDDVGFTGLRITAGDVMSVQS